MAKTHGAIRTLLEHMKAIAEQSGLTLEQVSDVLDGYSNTFGADTKPEPVLPPMPKRLH
jgi:hypothetical protein